MKIYIIIQGAGEYSGRSERPIRAYVDSAKAQAMMAKLGTIRRTIDPPRSLNIDMRTWFGPSPAVVQAAVRAYTELGFIEGDEGFDLADSDWELVECELIE